MKGEVLHYDDNVGTGQISGADGIRYSFERADLKQLVPISRGTRVDFDFDGKDAKDIYIDTPGGVTHGAPAGAPAYAAPPSAAPAYAAPSEPRLGLWGYFVRAYTSRFARITGRARRKEYWAVILFSTIIMIIGYGLVVAGLAADPPRFMTPDAILQAAVDSPVSLAGLAIIGVWLVLSILPGIGLLYRRVHDLGWSGWIAAILVILNGIGAVGQFIRISDAMQLVSGIGALALLIVAFMPGNPGENKYGPSPK